MSTRSISKGMIAGVALVLVVWAFTYLPNVNRFPYHRDDWYYMTDAFNAGAKVFRIMFWIDRPARGILFENLFNTFGLSTLAYNLSSVLWRLMSGLAALWLFRLLWPTKLQAALWGALLFMVYPGYLRLGAGVESQPHLLSVLLQVLSIALTLQALRTGNRAFKIGFWGASILAGWAYLLLVDYAFGMEVFRLLCVYIVVSQYRQGRGQLEKWIDVVRAWSPAAIIPAGYLIWRLLLFNNIRPETDVALQLSRLWEAPVLTGQLWFLRLLQSTLNATFLDWGVPLYRLFFTQDLATIRANLTLTVAIIGVLIVSQIILRRVWLGVRTSSSNAAHPDQRWAIQAATLGVAGVVAGVLPVIIANRTVTFEAYSHYALPASLAAVLMLIGLLFLVFPESVRLLLLISLVTIGTLTQLTVTSMAAREAETIRNFWWQVTWRAPDLRAESTLLANYGSFSYIEDTSAVWGPANIIYSPRASSEIPVEYEISAVPILPDRIQKILIAADADRYNYRTHTLYNRFRNMLVMSQPFDGACVHVMDGRWPRISTRDRMEIALVAPHSKIDNVVADGQTARPPSLIFGEEPPHAWCYFYQKAELALQSEDWEEVVRLGEQAWSRNLRPNDPVEWMPFLQAYAYLGHQDDLVERGRNIVDDPFLRDQACKTFEKMAEAEHVPSPAMVALTNELYCD